MCFGDEDVQRVEAGVLPLYAGAEMAPREEVAPVKRVPERPHLRDDGNYDIVIGAMADDQIYNYISDYMDGSITREQFWVLAKFKYPTHQINFCSKEALKCLEYRGFEVVK